MKLLIQKGRLVDPVGGIGGVMDILIEDGRLAVIGSDLRDQDAQVIDARGLTVCAGLVDMRPPAGAGAGVQGRYFYRHRGSSQGRRYLGGLHAQHQARRGQP